LMKTPVISMDYWGFVLMLALTAAAGPSRLRCRIQASRRKPSSGIGIENKFPARCIKRHFASIASRPKFATSIPVIAVSGSDCEQA
jgi:hypothetical protein